MASCMQFNTFMGTLCVVAFAKVALPLQIPTFLFFATNMEGMTGDILFIFSKGI